MNLVRVAALVTIAAAVVPAARAAPTPIRVQGLERIGAFKIVGGPADARRAFGKPTSQRDSGSDCTLTWPGLEISFYTLRYKRQCRDDAAFGAATITRPWVTDRGLRRGDPVSRAKRLYPDARKAGRNLGAGVGLIIKYWAAIGNVGLAAEVRDGRVTNLVIDYPLGGE